MAAAGITNGPGCVICHDQWTGRVKSVGGIIQGIQTGSASPYVRLDIGLIKKGRVRDKYITYFPNPNHRADA